VRAVSPALVGLAVLSTGALASCGKVEIVPVNAEFLQADAAWFQEEKTLFFFYEVTAEQGLGDPSVVEATWLTDDGLVDWTELTDLQPVHTHLPVECGPRTLCGSMSVRVDQEPRQVDLRMRYHRDGELALDADTVFNVVGPGPPDRSRSLLVYGVFDESNRQVQWRGRHLFPTVRNERATFLGLRRWFSVQDQAYGALDADDSAGRFYAYGADCSGFTPTDLPPVETSERAIFSQVLPDGASPWPQVCALATTTDAQGVFEAQAVAFKNPETRSAFPELRSPIRQARQVRFFLAPCSREIDAEAEAMQRQRLLSPESEVPTTCLDGWDQEGFVDGLIVEFTDAIESARAQGDDLVLVVGVHRDQAGAAAAVEEALIEVVVDERQRTSPRVAGAFVFDSDARGLDAPELEPTTLWCPSTLPLDQVPGPSARSCPILPDRPDIGLGPFSFNSLPILPTNRQYLDFIDQYSVGAAGEVTELSFLAPEFAATADHVDLGAFGVVTFLNGESFEAEPTDAFSHCVQEEFQPFVIRSELMQDPSVRQAILQACENDEGVPQALCDAAVTGVLTLEFLPDWHQIFAESSYEIGLFWQFPFLLRMDYEAVLAGAATAFGFSVPFGVAQPSQQLFGSEAWTTDTFSVDPALTHCRRFCDHGTFDSAGVYHPSDDFRTTYAHACYVPDFPEPGDGGFPSDP